MPCFSSPVCLASTPCPFIIRYRASHHPSASPLRRARKVNLLGRRAARARFRPVARARICSSGSAMVSPRSQARGQHWWMASSHPFFSPPLLLQDLTLPIFGDNLSCKAILQKIRKTSSITGHNTFLQCTLVHNHACSKL